MNKIIFLDIDGVLATPKQYQTNRTKFRGKHEIANRLRIPYPFDKDCVKIFNEIINETEAEIVLSSDWRTHWKIDEIGEIFEFNKVKYKPKWYTEVIKSFSNNYECVRVREIMSFVDEHKPKKWLAIDDMNLAQCAKMEILDNFIMTNEFMGLKQSEIKNKITENLNL